MEARADSASVGSRAETARLAPENRGETQALFRSERMRPREEHPAGDRYQEVVALSTPAGTTNAR